ncbi:glutathione peroxidase [soil metagenome]
MQPLTLIRRPVFSSMRSALCLMAVCGAASAPAQGLPAAAPRATASTACPAILQHTFARLQDEKPQALCQYTGKVVLIVNTASFCGFTSQYKGLEALDSKYRVRGLVVLGFPSNDFSQESGSNQQIADFCENTFGVKFPMFAKSSVRGAHANPLFRQLSDQSGTSPKWNFYKYLIGRDGKVVAAWSSITEPTDRDFLREVEKQLGPI